MNEEELKTLEQIWQGKRDWGPESESALDNLAAQGYIEIIEKHLESKTGQKAIDHILVKITDEGSGQLSSSAY
jgi:hypothetical protein